MFQSVIGIKADNVTIEVDNHHFQNCHFTNSTFIYGGGIVSIEDCVFHGTLKLVGSAKQTKDILAWAFKDNKDGLLELIFGSKTKNLDDAFNFNSGGSKDPTTIQ